MARKPSNNGQKSAAQRGGDGRFLPGNHTGKGRPAGSRNAASLLADRLAEEDAEEIIRAILIAAKAGEAWAAEIVSKRLWPIRRGRPTPLPSLPAVKSPADVPTALCALLGAVAAGELTSAEAADLAGVVEAVRRGFEIADIEDRLRRLEEAQQP